MDAIMECTNETNNPTTETCKVFDESNCVKQCNDNCSENQNSAENSIDSIKPQSELEDQGISDVDPTITNEFVNNLFPENGVTSEVKKPVEPVSEENVQCADQVAASKVNFTSNKRKLDSLIDSNIEEKKNFNMRKNIRGVLSENDFDTITIAAQREESERLARVQELKKSVKQRIIFTPSHSRIEQATLGAGAQGEKGFFKLESPDGSQLNKVNFGQIKLQRIEDKRVRRTFNQWRSLDRINKVDPDENEEVVTIDSSSDDDCIILSDSDEDCLADDADDDQHNSGLHVRDVLNIPDEHGKVLVNVGHVEGEPDIYMAPQIAKIIKPHQIGGVRFLFDNIIESTKRFNSSSGFGCILAHSMGLGKTLQVVCFCDIFLRHTEAKTVLCVMPINTIQNWMNEFNMWLPKESPSHEEVRPRHFNVFALTDQHKTMTARANVILQWSTEGGVLLIGYELFRVLGLKIARKKESKRAIENDKRLSEQIYTSLVKPGPDLVICDEGHRIKNAHAGISLALKQIRSRRRIVLTGYPLQNNLLEYWCMVDFVRPNYLGSKTEFCNMFERPIQNGQCIDSTPEDIKLMRYRAHVLHSLLVGFVQRRSDSVLQNSLPQKLEYVVLTKMTPFQRKLYDAFMNEVVRKKKVPNPLKAFAVCCKIWNHPDVLYKFLKKREFDYDLDIEEQEAIIKANAISAKPIKSANENDSQKDIPNKTSTDEPFYLNSCEPIGLHPSLDTFAAKENPHAFWQDGVNSVTTQAPKPDYVGLIAKSNDGVNDEEKAKCSSQIVDLDTKEVQLINSDIHTNLEISTASASGANSAKATPKAEAESQAANLNVKAIKNEVKAGSESIPYDWAYALIKDYEPGLASNSPKMQIFLYILEASIKMGDRVLVFSQSLLTLNLIEFFLQSLLIPDSQNYWKKNVSYFRLDGSTNAFERERLVTEFNRNTDVKLFLISTRAGSLGINLTGANRVIVFDASWNPCHDTQAVHRIYRYGQRKSCFVYRIVMDNCMEKNIYDRQVKKQGMSDRVVDECNPDAHLSIRELTNLCYDKVEEEQSPTFTQPIENYTDIVMRNIITDYKSLLSKEPFYHESLLIDRKDKKLSQTEKKLAKRAYEIEKKASAKPTYFMPNNIIPNRDSIHNPVFSQPNRQKFKETCKNPAIRLTRWIPAEVWQRQGMTSQEMTLPVDVAIPTNSNEASNIVVKAGEKVMILKSPKGVYMQLENGKIIAIKTSGEGAQHKLNADKKFINVLDATSRRKDIRNVRVERPNPADSDKDDVIVIDDNMSDSAETSGDSTYSKSQPESNTNKDFNSLAPPAPQQVFRNKQDIVPEIAHKEKKEKPLQHHFNKEKQETILQHHFNKEKPETIVQHHYNASPQVFGNKEKATSNGIQKDKPETLLQTHQKFEPQSQIEPPLRTNYVEKHCNTLFGNIPNCNQNAAANIPNNQAYNMSSSHNMENQHLTAMPPNQWDNKSPELFKQQSVKISNIPAPYPSTAISDMNAFDKNANAQQPASNMLNVDQYPIPPYPQQCTNPEENVYHHNPNPNLNTNYYSNSLPTTSTENNASLNALYRYNNKNETNYSEQYFDSSSTSHTNYHQQISKYSYDYYQPQYLPNFSNKAYDSNAYSPTFSSQSYMRRPSAYFSSPTNGVDVGLNYTEPQGWIKKHHPG